MKNEIFLYQISYSDEHLELIDSDFIPLDNRENLRPDWREYWPMRKYLLGSDLSDNCYYGFFSPKFKNKTGLSGLDVKNFIQNKFEFDVFTFSPQADMGGLFLNVFEQWEVFDVGFIDATQDLLINLGFSIDLKSMVMDSRQVVFSNFIVARPSFWRKWLFLCEKIFEIAEAKNSDLAEKINFLTSYPGAVARKVFIIERMASFLIASEGWSCAPYSTYQCAWSALPTAKFQQEVILSDALKIAFNETRNEEYIKSFSILREKIFFSTKVMDKDLSEEIVKKELNAVSSPVHRNISSCDLDDGAMKQTPPHTIVNVDLLNLIPPDASRIVEVGCMHGAMARAYRELNPSAYYCGIDIDPKYAEIAAQFCNKTLGADIESLDKIALQELFPSDCWIFGDCLEHLRDPWRIMRMVRDRIDPNGCMLICIPNAQHWSVQMRLAIGAFRYEDSGLLDRTHLQWFTRTTLLEMFSETGWKIEHGFSRKLPIQPPSGLLDGIKTMALAVGADVEQAVEDAMAFQYIFRLRTNSK